jgi:hypothetical protein
MKKRGTYDSLKLPNLLAQRRLRRMQMFGCASYIQFLSDCHKVAKQSQFHEDFLGCQEIVP